jgi:hypothetical protein
MELSACTYFPLPPRSGVDFLSLGIKKLMAIQRNLPADQVLAGHCSKGIKCSRNSFKAKLQNLNQILDPAENRYLYGHRFMAEPVLDSGQQPINFLHVLYWAIPTRTIPPFFSTPNRSVTAST